MSMPIQRQSEGYGIFDDGNLRFARDYETRDLPEGLVNALSHGVGITAGLNDPRRMAREAGFGAYPDSNNFAREDLSGHGGYDPHGEDHFQEEDQFSQHPPEDPYAGHDPHAVPEMPLDQLIEQHQSEAHHFPPEEPVHFARHADYDEQFRNHTSFSEAHSGGPAPSKTAAAAPAADPMAGWVGHGYVPGHRVGLPWREQTIPGTVTHLDGQQVGIRWDDGQHSTEEPSDLRPL